MLKPGYKPLAEQIVAAYDIAGKTSVIGIDLGKFRSAIGSLFHRNLVGWRSQSVRNLSGLDKDYRSIRAVARHIEQEYGRTEEWREL